MKRTGSSNPNLRKLIEELKTLSIKQEVKLWKRIASDLEKPSRMRRIVNLTKLDKNTKDNETVIVPGKVLAKGTLGHQLTIAAYQFSEQAMEKLTESKCTLLTLSEFMEKDPKAKKARLIG